MNEPASVHGAKSIHRQATFLHTVGNAISESQAFDEAVHLIVATSHSVFTTGIGKAGLIARKVAATLTSTGTPSHFLHPVDGMHGDIGAIPYGALLLAFSNSGRTQELLEICYSACKYRECRIIAITSMADCSLSSMASVIIPYGIVEENDIPTVSTTAMLAIGDALALAVMEQRGKTLEDIAENHPGGTIGKRLGTCADHMRPMSDVMWCRDYRTIGEMIEMFKDGKRWPGLIVLVDDWPDGNGISEITGVVSQADIIRYLAKHGTSGLLDEICSAEPDTFTTIRYDQPITEAVKIMREKKISEIPVVGDDNKPVGLLDITDLIGIFPELKDEPT